MAGRDRKIPLLDLPARTPSGPAPPGHLPHRGRQAPSMRGLSRQSRDWGSFTSSLFLLTFSLLFLGVSKGDSVSAAASVGDGRSPLATIAPFEMRYIELPPPPVAASSSPAQTITTGGGRGRARVILAPAQLTRQEPLKARDRAGQENSSGLRPPEFCCLHSTLLTTPPPSSLCDDTSPTGGGSLPL